VAKDFEVEKGVLLRLFAVLLKFKEKGNFPNGHRFMVSEFGI